jgi:hypothetical protein
LLGFGRRAVLGFELLEQLDGREVVPALLFERAAAQLVGIGDAVVVLVTQRLKSGCRRLFRDDDGAWFYSSGGRKR